VNDALEPDPFALFRRWYEDAVAAGLELAEAVALATAAPDGRPSARMVLYKGIEDGALLFYTNYQSRKARELEANPRAALLFYWQPLSRQVRVEGAVERTSTTAADA